MVLAVAFDEAVKRRVTRVHPHKAAGTTQTAFFGFPDQPDLPHACLNELVPGHSSTTHFHVRDQFQVVVGGKGTLGRHELAPYRVHFSRAYTPYGPLISDAGDGLKFFVMRAHRDIGSQRELSRLQDMPDRRPWQATCTLSFPTTHTADTVLESISDIKDEEGLAAYALSMKPGTHARAPDHSHGDGQYLLVLKGSVLHEGKELKGYALIFITPQEAAYQIQAGAQGASILVLNFPERVVRAKAATHSADADFKTWQCALCSFVYDEAQGLPEEGIAPGTRWQEVPEAWSCPDCAASKSDFQMTELVKT